MAIKVTPQSPSATTESPTSPHVHFASIDPSVGRASAPTSPRAISPGPDLGTTLSVRPPAAGSAADPLAYMADAMSPAPMLEAAGPAPTAVVAPAVTRRLDLELDRRASDEWDASKVPPSRFQKPKGSIWAVPASRDGHVDHSYHRRYYEKLVEKGWIRRKRSVSGASEGGK